jgi:DNA-binding IclR family transcriptional regulator
MGKNEDQIVEVLKKNSRPMTLVEIAEQVGRPSKKVFSSIRKLFENGTLDCDHKNRTYQLAKQ